MQYDEQETTEINAWWDEMDETNLNDWIVDLVKESGKDYGDLFDTSGEN